MPSIIMIKPDVVNAQLKSCAPPPYPYFFPLFLLLLRRNFPDTVAERLHRLHATAVANLPDNRSASACNRRLHATPLQPLCNHCLVFFAIFFARALIGYWSDHSVITDLTTAEQELPESRHRRKWCKLKDTKRKESEPHESRQSQRKKEARPFKKETSYH
jgi:hypothetical protein